MAKEVRLGRNGIDTSAAVQSFLQDSHRHGNDTANVVFEFNYFWKKDNKRWRISKAYERVTTSFAQEISFLAKQTEPAIFATCVYLTSAASLIANNPPVLPRMIGLY